LIIKKDEHKINKKLEEEFHDMIRKNTPTFIALILLLKVFLSGTIKVEFDPYTVINYNTFSKKAQ